MAGEEAVPLGPDESYMGTRGTPTVTLSLSMKVNLGNYESAEAFLSISGVGMSTTQEEIDAVLDGPARIAYDALKARMGEKVAELRGKKGPY